MNKSEMAERLADRIGLSKSAAPVALDVVFREISDVLANGNEVRILGFGTFTTKHREGRTDRNPRIGETLQIPASKAPSFGAGKALRDAVNGGWESGVVS